MALRAFGDSITVPYGPSTPTKGYISLLAADLGGTFTNTAVSGAMIWDQYDNVFPVNVAPGDKSILWLGTNEQARYAFDAGKRQLYGSAMRASIIHLASSVTTPSPANTEFTGSWSTVWGWYGAYASGAKASFFVTGTKVALTIFRQANNPGAYQIWIDGEERGVFYVAANGDTGYGRAYGPRCHYFNGLEEGTHLVEIQALTASMTWPVYFHWFSDCAPVARVCVPNVPHAVSYGGGGSARNVDAYNLTLAKVVEELACDGLDVHLVDVSSVLTAGDFMDAIHPGDSGHQKIKDLIYPVISAP
jgi:hypothetical protein